MDSDELQIHNQSLNVNIKEVNKDLEEKKWVISRLKEKSANNNHLIEIPKMNIEQIESVLKLGDKFLLNTLIDYLKLDSYELTKSIPWVLNESNVIQAIAYIDGALQRNENLIKSLSKYSKEVKKAPEYMKTNKKL